jgi:hypothetical protein
VWGGITQNTRPPGSTICQNLPFALQPPGAQRFQALHLRLDVIGVDVEANP